MKNIEKSRKYYTNKTKIVIIPTIHNPVHNQNQIKNFHLIVL